jgi:hypothetical protein
VSAKQRQRLVLKPLRPATAARAEEELVERQTQAAQEEAAQGLLAFHRADPGLEVWLLAE